MPRKTFISDNWEELSASFNEAAARCRGKRVGWGETHRRRYGFNEAAARCRGKPADDVDARTGAPSLQ